MENKIQHTATSIWQKARLFCLTLVLISVVTLMTPRAEAQTRLVVSDVLGLNSLRNNCFLLGCTVEYGLGDPNGQLFLVEIPRFFNVASFLSALELIPGVAAVEVDQLVFVQEAQAGSPPDYLTNETPVDYYGTSVWQGYISQPANQLIRTSATQTQFQTTGSGVIVAVIDTGVDPNNPILSSLLVSGYDFTRNRAGGSEMADVNQPVTVSAGDGGVRVSQSAVAVLDQSAVAVLDGSPYAAFGHGTMVSGIVHLVAPQTQIMPLKAFHADGTAYSSDVLRAIYYAVNHGANVINMSFNYSSYSQELENAVNYAANNGVISVAAAGNSGLQTEVYPAAFGSVIDVASTDNSDIQSSFTNYGAPPVWLAAPGEGIMTTYPFGTYAAGWGTSFSTPFASGTAALMVSMYRAQVLSQTHVSLVQQALSLSLQLAVGPPSSQFQAANAFSHADNISAPQLGHGRLDTYEAVGDWAQTLGLQ